MIEKIREAIKNSIDLKKPDAKNFLSRLALDKKRRGELSDVLEKRLLEIEEEGVKSNARFLLLSRLYPNIDSISKALQTMENRLNGHDTSKNEKAKLVYFILEMNAGREAPFPIPFLDKGESDFFRRKDIREALSVLAAETVEQGRFLTKDDFDVEDEKSYQAWIERHDELKRMGYTVNDNFDRIQQAKERFGEIKKPNLIEKIQNQFQYSRDQKKENSKRSEVLDQNKPHSNDKDLS